MPEDDISALFGDGDLTRMHELDALAAAANKKGEWSEMRRVFATEFWIFCCGPRMALYYTHSFISLNFTYSQALF